MLAAVSVTYEIGRYTVLTGESIFQGFIRLQRHFAFFLWILMTLSFLWFGAFAAAGGTSLAALTNFPAGWSARGQTLFWGYTSMLVFLVAILLSKVIYQLVEAFMWGVALLTLGGTTVGKCQCRSPACAAGFRRGFVRAGFIHAETVGFCRRDEIIDCDHLRRSRRLLDAFLFLLGARQGRRYGPLHGSAHRTDYRQSRGDPYFRFHSGNDEGLAHVRRWRHYLFWDISIGIGGNLLTTLMTCLLAYALLFPKGLLPQGYELAVVQSRFFEVSWGVLGRFLFLIVAARVSLATPGSLLWMP